jgi:hypothetical protein
MKITLTLHDFSKYNTRFDLLDRLKDLYPNFKVTMFTIPDDFKHKDNINELNGIRQRLEWIQIVPHGLKHNSSEAKRWTYEQFRYVVIPEIDKIFKREGLPYQRGFVSPHWDTCKDVAQVLTDLDWFQAISPKRKDQPHAKRFYIHDYTINEDFPLDRDLKLQGHLNSTSPDNLELCFNNLTRLPKETQWCFVSVHQH